MQFTTDQKYGKLLLQLRMESDIESINKKIV